VAVDKPDAALGEVADEPLPTRPSRARSARARQTILNAADDLLVEQGFAGVTIEGIAARAGVAKQTIYRWWPSKVELLMDSFLDDAEQELAAPDTGSTAEDLRRHLRQLADFLAHAPAGRVLRALIGQAQHDPRMALDFRERYLKPRREHDRRILTRGVARGEIAPQVDLDVVLDALHGPIYYRALVTGAVNDAALIDALIDQVLPALAGVAAEPPTTPALGPMLFGGA
jgi:AcrR family transcriptional regulator